MRRRGPLSLALAWSLAACATSGEPNPRGAGQPEAVAAALALSAPPARAPQNKLARAMAFVSADSGGTGKVLAVDLATRKVVWTAEARALGRIETGRDVVLFSEPGDSLIALDVATGRTLWNHPTPTGAALIGYATDGQRGYAVYGLKEKRAGELVGFDLVSGRIDTRTRLADRVGAPAARGGLVAVPQRSQYVTLIDGHNGKVLAEILSREEAASFVRALPEGFVFGSQGVFIASEDNAIASRKSDHYLKAQLPEWVRAVYHYDMYKPTQTRYSALDRNRLLWRVRTGGGELPGFQHGLVIVHNFRFFFAIEADSGELRWAYSHPRVDVIGAAHVGRALVFVDADGQVGALDTSNGRLLALAPMQGAPAGALGVVGVSFDAEGFYKEGEGAAPAEPLVDVLKGIVLDPDRRFSDVRLFAVDQLARLRKPGVTAALLDILDNGSEHDLVVQRASDSLVALRDPGSLEVYLRAVRTHPDYATSRKTARLDLMARALGELGARKAMPDLCEHLRIPDTDPAVVRDIANAVLRLEAREVVPEFRDYLAQYRADPAFGARPGALIASAEVLARLGGSEDRSFLLFLGADPRTVTALASAIERLLAEADAAP